jgi:alkylation response protein AidB-like acyl-CoA dehydrogenase
MQVRYVYVQAVESIIRLRSWGDNSPNKALQVVGGRNYLKGHAAERLVRDARAGALMAFTAEQNKDLLGKVLLGLHPREAD